MAHAAHMLEHHYSLATEASSILIYVVDFDIRLLQNSYGNLDPNFMWPLESIEDFQQELNSHRDDFPSLSNVPSEIQVLSTGRVKKAQHIMKALMEQASQNRQST